MKNHTPTYRGHATESVTLWRTATSSAGISSFSSTKKKQEILRSWASSLLFPPTLRPGSQPLANHVSYLFYPEADLLARHSKNTNVPLCLEQLQYWCLAAEGCCRNIKWAMWMLSPHEEHCQKLSYPEDQPYGKAEGKAPTGRLWNV